MSRRSLFSLSKEFFIRDGNGINIMIHEQAKVDSAVFLHAEHIPSVSITLTFNGPISDIFTSLTKKKFRKSSVARAF